MIAYHRHTDKYEVMEMVFFHVLHFTVKKHSNVKLDSVCERIYGCVFTRANR